MILSRGRRFIFVHIPKTGGTALGLKADAYQDIEFNFVLTPLQQGKDNQLVQRLRAAA